MSADYTRTMPTIDLTDDEIAAVTAAVRRAIETDRFPRAPRLGLAVAIVTFPMPSSSRHSKPRTASARTTFVTVVFQ
jgi:hypothetical protein